MNTTTITDKAIQIAEFKMIQAYVTAGLSKLGVKRSDEQGSAHYHHYWHLSDAASAAREYADLAGLDIDEVREEMLKRFIFTD